MVKLVHVDKSGDDMSEFMKIVASATKAVSDANGVRGLTDGDPTSTVDQLIGAMAEHMRQKYIVAISR